MPRCRSVASVVEIVLWFDRVLLRSNGGVSVNESYVGKIAGELKVAPRQVAATAALLTEGATVPFIARYRKEATGTLDEVAVTQIRDRMAQLAELSLIHISEPTRLGMISY